MLILLQFTLKFFAKKILSRYRPRVIAVAGSVGKSSAKEAIFAVSSTLFTTVRKAEGSYNNELGVPLTIIGETAQGKNIMGWFRVLWRALRLSMGAKVSYPELLVLEFGEDHPGDIVKLMRFVRPSIGVLTAIEEVHVEFFKSIEAVEKEVSAVLQMLPSQEGIAIANADDERIRRILKNLGTRVFTTGIGAQSFATLSARDVEIIEHEGVLGLRLKLQYEGSVVPLFMPYIVSYAQIHSILLGCAVGLALGMNLIEVSNAIQKYEQPNGRLKVVPGIHDSIVLDDTYNSSPAASRMALLTLASLPETVIKRRIAVFGDMLELGDFATSGHAEVGKKAQEVRVDMLITVGELAAGIARGAKEAGMDSSHIHVFSTSQEASGFLRTALMAGDAVLVKGSQGARMERVVKALMVNPQDASRLLVRQGELWQKKI